MINHMFEVLRPALFQKPGLAVLGFDFFTEVSLG